MPAPARVRRAARLAAVAALVALCLAMPVGRSEAAYQVVSGELVQWDWARVADTNGAGAFRVTDLVVRDDGWMIVSTSAYADGHLHLVPPWGGPIDAGSRFGPTKLGFRQLELRRGRLYGLRQSTEREDERKHSPGELYELDPSTGAVLRTLGTWWFQDLAVDPRTDELLLQEWGGAREPYPHGLARFDPDRGVTTVVVPDDEPRSDRALEVAVSPDGERLYTANVTDLSPTIDVRRRDGTRLHTLQSGQVDSMTVGRPGTCFEGLLLLTRFDGSVWGLRTEEGAQPVLLAGGGHAGVVSYGGLDAKGNLAAARYSGVTLLACPGFVPPKAPVAAPAPPPVVAAAAPPASPAAPSPAPPAAPTPPAAPSAAPPPPPPAAPPPPPPASPVPAVPPGALGSAISTSGAPSAAAADAPDEEHITSVPASAPVTLAVLVGASVAMAMVAYASAAASPSHDPLRTVPVTTASRRTRSP